jgi:hypothetical protein
VLLSIPSFLFCSQLLELDVRLYELMSAERKAQVMAVLEEKVRTQTQNQQVQDIRPNNGAVWNVFGPNILLLLLCIVFFCSLAPFLCRSIAKG